MIQSVHLIMLTVISSVDMNNQLAQAEINDAENSEALHSIISNLNL